MAWPGWLLDLWTKAEPYADKAAVWRGYEGDLTNLTIVAVGVTVYTLLVFTFYRNLSLRAAFHSDVGKGTWWGRGIHALETTFVFPVMSFVYFGFLALALFLLAPPTQSTYQIFLLSMAVVVAVRLTSFITEGASGDLAKLLPLALLGVMIVNPVPLTWDLIWSRYREVVTLIPVLARFFLLFLVLETGLRLGHLVMAKLKGSRLYRGRRPAGASDAVRVDVKEPSVLQPPKAP